MTTTDFTDYDQTGYTESTEQAPSTAESTAKPAKSSTSAKTKELNRQRERDRATRANLRAGARKVIQVQEAGAEVRAVVAQMAGVDDDDVEVAVALCGPRNNTSAVLKDLEELISSMASDPLSAGIRLMGMGPDRTRPIWNLLHSIDVLPARIPAAETRAATDLARAIQELDESKALVLAAAAELAG